MPNKMQSTLTGSQSSIYLDFLREGRDREAREYCNLMLYLNNTLKRKYPQHERQRLTKILKV